MKSLNLEISPEQIRISNTDLTILIPSDTYFNDQFCDKLIDIEYELRKKFPMLYISIVPEPETSISATTR
ncbi:MAG: hypothetical protein J7L34_07735 [Thermotogaceae bacterium]|nr:hypothetical protein [Thermotogaceae bacterium]